MGAPKQSGHWTGFRAVLCPIDFSDHARLALRYAEVVALRAKASLTVTYANDPLLIAAAAAALHIGSSRSEAPRSCRRSPRIPSRWLHLPRHVEQLTCLRSSLRLVIRRAKSTSRSSQGASHCRNCGKAAPRCRSRTSGCLMRAGVRAACRRAGHNPCLCPSHHPPFRSVLWR